MARTRVILISSIVIIGCLLILTPLLVNRHFLLVSGIITLLTFLPFVIRFEKRRVTGRELVMLAVLAAIAAVSRVPFAAIPSVQPTSFVIIMTGLVFGAESGFVVGALAALVSNLFLGQGPWTPWQMYSWGMLGLVAGFLRNTSFMQRTYGRVIYGFTSGIVYGWIMNLWYVVSLGDNFRLEEVIKYYAASIYFDLAHAVSNAFFIIVFANSWIKILQRFRKKYGLLE
ncbi:ECF transporter S component [Metabacillus niabensis]|uniref:Energy-coupling factor transport system substrate-specific component n=1 Tax=Metabacillus niabensis TaxID=324854 RepID=A0ABT9YZI3_9BACI|nr:ECF transporter S component [Metabacillus niabensis]MDQ0225404.1 energy-coupling factor transport system substrate-specific component [Metabacillus niabensis]